MLHWYICLRYLTCWLCWLICLDWGFQYHDFMCFIDIFVWDIDMLDCCWLIILYCLAHWLRFLPWLSWSPHMHTLTTVYHLVGHVDSFAYIFSWSSLSRIFISLFHLIVIACMCAWVIYLVLYLTACRMTTFPLLDCMSRVHVGRTSIPLPPNLLVSVIPFILVLTFASVRPSVCSLSNRARD